MDTFRRQSNGTNIQGKENNMNSNVFTINEDGTAILPSASGRLYYKYADSDDNNGISFVYVDSNENINTISRNRLRLIINDINGPRFKEILSVVKEFLSLKTTYDVMVTTDRSLPIYPYWNSKMPNGDGLTYGSFVDGDRSLWKPYNE